MITAETVPLKTDVDDVIRVGKTRVTLDTIIAAFQEGATAEEIAQQYPSVDLADVYSVISYYLRRQSEVEVYLRQRQQQSEQVRKQNESRFDRNGMQQRVLVRRKSTSRNL